jgi:hypothetical protein
MVLMAMSVIGLGGVIEGLVRRIVLGDDALYITDMWTRRRIPKSEIRGATARQLDSRLAPAVVMTSFTGSETIASCGPLLIVLCPTPN